MTTFAGLDVSQAKTTVCIVDERGLVTRRGSCASSPIAIARTPATRGIAVERWGGEFTPWLVHELRASRAGGVLGCAPDEGGLVDADQ